MPYAVTSTTTYDPPAFSRSGTVSWSRSSVFDHTNTARDDTFEGTVEFRRTWIDYDHLYSSATTSVFQNSIKRPAAAGGDSVFEATNTTFRNRTFVGPTTTITLDQLGNPQQVTTSGITWEIPTVDVGESTETTTNLLFRRATNTFVSSTLVWTTETYPFTDGTTPMTATELVQEESTILVAVESTIFSNTDTAPVQLTTRLSTFKETASTDTCDTVLISFPDYQRTLCLLPTANFSDLSMTAPASLLSATTDSFVFTSYWESHAITGQTHPAWPLGGLSTASTSYQRLTLGFPATNWLTLTETRQTTMPFNQGRQFSTTTSTYLGRPSSTTSFSLITLATAAPVALAWPNYSIPRVSYPTVGTVVDITSTWMNLIGRATATEQSASTASSEVDRPFVNLINHGVPFAQFPSGLVTGVTATLTQNTRGVPIFDYRTRIDAIQSGTAIGYEHGAGVATSTISPPPGLGFAPLASEWTEAHRALIYSVPYREVVRSFNRGLSRGIISPIGTSRHRVGTFGMVIDDVFVPGFTGTEYLASLNFNSVTFSKIYSTTTPEGTVTTTETLGHTMDNLLTDPQTFYRVAALGHAHNPVTTVLRGSYAFTHNESTGVTHGPQTLTLNPKDVFSAKALPYLVPQPVRNQSVTQL